LHKFSQERKHGRLVNPDELFLVTHKKKDDAWVDTRAHEVYVGFQ